MRRTTVLGQVRAVLCHKVPERDASVDRCGEAPRAAQTARLRTFQEPANLPGPGRLTADQASVDPPHQPPRIRQTLEVSVLPPRLAE
jgi:hypothetical protein